MDPTVLGVLVVAMVVIDIVLVDHILQISHTSTTKITLNSDAKVRQILLNLLAEARAELVMYDDGDPGPESFYESEEFVNAIRVKLKNYPSFRVRCVLNYPSGETRFEQEFRNDAPRVIIAERTSAQSRVHYKIIDGRKAYVSCHRREATRRNRRIIDCSNGLPLWPLRKLGIRPFRLRQYFRDFEGHAVGIA